MGMIGKILRAGRVAEPKPRRPERLREADGLCGSVQVRHVDAGSCNGCEIELGQAFSPVYDAERFGARLVASPRHADAITVTGPVTVNMVEALRKTYEAMPEPRRVLSIGDCARSGGAFAGGHGVAGTASDVVPVDLHVPGCPPEPAEIVAALRGLTGR
jgi:Ni,Fe-hydrogenase III small subunit